MTIRSIGIVGHGNFGALIEVLAQRFVPSVTVRICSSRREPDGTRFFSLEDTTRCDVVILVVPIAAFEESVKRIAPFLGEEAILVDVATVKVHTGEVLRRLLGTRRYVATHPMWGPESYGKKGGDVTGFRIVITEHTLSGEGYRGLVSVLSSCGFTVLSMGAETHDKHLAETLFLTHFLGQVVARGGFDRTQIDTVSFGFLMDAVESVKHDAALFLDVYRFNPYCKEVLERFDVSERDLRAMLDTSVGK